MPKETFYDHWKEAYEYKKSGNSYYFRTSLEKAYRLESDNYIIEDIQNLHEAGELRYFIENMATYDWDELADTLNHLNLTEEKCYLYTLVADDYLVRLRSRREVDPVILGNLIEGLQGCKNFTVGVKLVLEYVKIKGSDGVLLRLAREAASVSGDPELKRQVEQLMLFK